MNDEWRTPPALFAVLNERHGFTLDAASSHQNALTKAHLTIEDDALTLKQWGRWPITQPAVVWCNPPYSTGMIPAFIRKALEQIEKGYVREAVFLIRADTSTRYWHELVLPYSSEILFVDGRVNFLTANGETDKGSGTKGARSPNFASVVVVFRKQVVGVSLPPVYGTVCYDRGKRYGNDEGVDDRLPGDTRYRPRQFRMNLEEKNDG